VAIEHLLYVGDGTSAAGVHRLVCRVDGVRPHLAEGRLGFAGNNVAGSVSVTDDVVRGVLAEDLGLAAHVTVLFRLDKFALTAGEDALVACVARVLDGCTSDLALVAYGDVDALRRTSGALTVDEQVGLWTPARIASLVAAGSGPAS
jgi:hypothetical protein